MPRTEIAILLLLFAGVSPAAGEDDDLTTRRVSKVYVPAGYRDDQLGELVRQLNVPAFVDLGRDWGDHSDEYRDYSRPPFSQVLLRKR